MKIKISLKKILREDINDFFLHRWNIKNNEVIFNINKFILEIYLSFLLKLSNPNINALPIANHDAFHIAPENKY